MKKKIQFKCDDELRDYKQRVRVIIERIFEFDGTLNKKYWLKELELDK